MILLILGFVLLITAGLVARSDEKLRRFGGPVRIIGVIIMIIGLLATSIIQIDAGEVGVKKLFGKVQQDVLPSGLHFINPLLEIQKLDIKTQNYTMSGVH